MGLGKNDRWVGAYHIESGRRKRCRNEEYLAVTHLLQICCVQNDSVGQSDIRVFVQARKVGYWT